jgi:kinetochore protein Spc7/SPC105
LALGFQPPPSSTTTATADPASPKKKPGIGLGRASLGSGSSNAWARFNKDVGQAVAAEPPTSKVVENEAEALSCVRETVRQVSASPSPTRGSPAPLPNNSSSNPKPQVPSVEPEELVIEPAQTAEPQDIGELPRTTGIDIDATQQWREGVQQDDQYEEDAVWIKLLFLDFVNY